MNNIKSIEKNINNLVLLIDKIELNLYNKNKLKYEKIICELYKDIEEIKNISK